MDTNVSTEEDMAVSSQYSNLQQPSHQQGQYVNEDMEYFVAGRAYRSHDPHHLDSSNVIEMANIYRPQQQPCQPQEHTNQLVNGYNHYVRNRVSAYTSGNGRTKNHPQQMMSNQHQQGYI